MHYFVFVERDIGYHMSSFNENAGLGLLKLDPIELGQYPFPYFLYCVIFCLFVFFI